MVGLENACDNTTAAVDEDEEEYHFDHMWILIGAIVFCAYLLAAVILVTLTKSTADRKQNVSTKFSTK